MNTVDVDKKIVEVSKFVRARFASRRGPADPDDIEQEAALAAVKTARRYQLRGNPFSYLCQAAFRECALSAARETHAFSFSERARKEKRVTEGVRVKSMGRAEPVATGSTDDKIVRVEEALQQQHLRIRMRARIARAVALLGAEPEQRAAAMFFGLDEEPADIGEVVWRTGMARPAIRVALRRVRHALAADPEVARLRGVISAQG